MDYLAATYGRFGVYYLLSMRVSGNGANVRKRICFVDSLSC